VISVAGGVGAALAFSATTLCYARLAHVIGPYVALSWVMLVGLVITAPLVAVTGVPGRLDAASTGWLALAGVGNVGGLVLTYKALRSGKVALVAPIVSTEGAVAAVISVAAGEKIAVASAVTLVLIVAGILLASTGHGLPGTEARPDTLGIVVLSVLSAAAFGASLYAVGRVGRELPVAWALLPARAVGVGVIALPLALTSRLRLPRPAIPFVLAGGTCEVIGIASYSIGARHGIAVSAVLASQFGAVAAFAGFLLFHERLTRVQVLGVAAVAVGVAALSALQA
jgi:drug/metabolite transporter (DMT)-like permease